ncbi:alpha/beta fold hydrolase [Candidatus Saccharibacteria bacterium]|nr:alpha/beta fold hydrolase [Candidatus Saccharibacteria bacterium]
MSKPHVIILAPGWGETAVTMRPLRQLLESNGHTVVSVEHSRRRSGSQQEVMAARADDILAVVAAYDQTVTVIAHSLGAVDAVAAAQRLPEVFRHLILVNPAGIACPMAMARLMARFSRKLLHDPAGQWRVGTGSAIKNLRLAYLEGLSAAGANLDSALHELVDKDVKITVLASAEDVLFRYSDIDGRLAKHPRIQLIEITGTHDAIHRQPERYIDNLQQILTLM